MAIAQILKATTEAKDGMRPYQPVTYVILNTRPPRCRKNQRGHTAGDERCGGNKVFVISYLYRVRCKD